MYGVLTVPCKCVKYVNNGVLIKVNITTSYIPQTMLKFRVGKGFVYRPMRF